MRHPFRVVAAAVTLAAAAIPSSAAAHAGSPNFTSVIRDVSPQPSGLTFDVLGGDDRIEIVNHSGRTVTVLGYEGEPYARMRADGTVQVNRNSPALYLNEERFTDGVQVPSGATAKGAPRWTIVNRSGRFEWHDHRIHYMTKGTPPQVVDKDRRTTVFDWSVPVRVGTTEGAIAGRLLWTPADTSGPPAGAIAAFALVAVGGIALTLATRRRRRLPSEDHHEQL